MHINDIRHNVINCHKCHLRETLPELSTPVSGEGNPNADIFILGECPGCDEMALIRPFVGQAGQLLNKILPQADIKREDCYISNCIKCWCRTPNGKANRPSTREEVNFCKRWLWDEIQLVNPKVILTLGKVATYTLLNKQLNQSFSMKSVLNNHFFVEYHKAIIVPAYHPSFLLQHGKQYIEDTIKIFTKAREISEGKHLIEF